MLRALFLICSLTASLGLGLAAHCAEASLSHDALKAFGKIFTNDQNELTAVSFGPQMKVRLENPDVTDVVLKELANFPKLEQILLQNCINITDKGVQHLKSLPNVKVLHIGGMIEPPGVVKPGSQIRPEAWKVRLPGIGDASLAAIAGWQKLERLYLTNTAVSDAGLTHLAGMKHLEILDIRATAVTKAGVEQLQAALPKLTINY